MDLSFTYDQQGKLSKFSIKSNQIDETEKLPLLLPREQISAVIEEVLAESERGVLLRRSKGISTGSGYGEATVYEKAQITPMLDSTQNARLVCISYLRPAASHIGAVAQLGERMTGSHEVRGSIPLGSTNIYNSATKAALHVIWRISRAIR